MVSITKRKCQKCGDLRRSFYANWTCDPESSFIFLVPPYAKQSQAVFACTKMFEKIFGKLPGICSIVKCTQPNARTIPLKAVRQCATPYKKVDKFFIDGIFLFGRDIQKAVLGKSLNVNVAGGRPAVRDGITYIVMPELRDIDDLMACSDPDSRDECIDALSKVHEYFEKAREYYATKR